MAGNYPDAPARLFPIDVDGTVGFYIENGTVRVLTTAEKQRFVSEGAGTTNIVGNWVPGPNYWGYIFPELRSLAGYFYDISTQSGATPGTIEYSNNTTTGLDGAWTSIESLTGGHWTNADTTGASMNARLGYRSPRAISVASCKSVRISTSSGATFWRWCGAFHAYGAIVAASDRLTLWHPTLDQELSGPALDFGDVLRSTTTDKTFRVKNLSSTMTANSVLLSVTSLTDTSPTYVSQYTVGVGGSYAATQTIASIAPGAISAVYTLRLTTAAAASLTTWRQRLSAVPATWS